MKNRNVLQVGSLDVPVSRTIYNAANCEFERVNKRDQRLRRDGLLYETFHSVSFMQKQNTNQSLMMMLNKQ